MAAAVCAFVVLPAKKSVSGVTGLGGVVERFEMP
jgi:hypothetical protein